ncbi:MAG TPA: TonB-dependent receptor [Gammaproteobacteria bacterium]|nr:TonB-dependent receptor [Gammaproteobacteria bacterium]
MLALGLGGSFASAQEGSAPEEVVVTGSRITNTNGMETPVPVTVVTPTELSVLAPTNIIEGLAELPQFYGSATTQTPSPFFTSTGAGSLNLRGLQDKRTLQLLDGRRVVPSTIFGGPDINLFPENILRSVETVTGGASAAYGTDAVAGVVNFILDKDFEGVKANFQVGENGKGDNQTYKASVGGGFRAGGRTHVLFNVEKERQDPIWGTDVLDYDWYKSRALIDNPAPGAGSSPDNPFYIAVNDVRARGFDIDGIFYLPAAAGGPQILDSSGNPSPFVLGSPCNASGCSTTNGGSGHDSQLASINMTPESGRENVFAYLTHDFTDKFTAYGQVIHGKADFTQLNFGGLFPYPSVPPFRRNFTIYSGNPFLPPAIQAAMTANGVASVPFSRIGAPEDIAANAATTQTTTTDSYTGGFDYSFEGSWHVKGYYQSGETDVKAIQKGGIRLDRIYLAADVVVDPNTGQPACNVTVVSGLYPDCVPLDLFGRGRASAAAIDWVTGFEPGVPIHANGFLSATESIPYDYISGENKQRVITIDQDVWEVSADGQIAEGWAGPITMAAGYGGRKESFVQVVEVGPGGNINADPTFRPVMANNAALGIRGVPGGNAASGNSVEIQFSNVPFARGSQDVTETFTEFLVPLVHDQGIVQQLNFSAAYRYADYSGVGGVDSWKGGFDWTVNDQLRLRATVSQDVRAATMGEKFDRTGGVANVTDYLLDPGGGVSYGITTFSNGTPDIRPENARTKVFGFVYQPHWADGISASVDAYSIEVSDNINQVTAAQVVSGCYVDNDVDLCKFITRTGPPSTQDPSVNYISLVGVPYFNQASVRAEGVDVEINYRKDVDWFGGGAVSVRFFGTHLRERSNTDSAGNKTEVQGRFGFPKTTGLVSGTFLKGPLSVGLTARYTGEQLINPNWNFNGTSTRWDVADNTLESEVLVDGTVRYRFGKGDNRMSVFATINNLFDKDPQEYLALPFSDTFSTGPGLGVTGDERGRRYALGLALDF